MEKKWERFATILCEALKNDFENAIKDHKKTQDSDKKDFYAGYLAAFHHLFTLVKENSESADIPMSDLSLDKFKEEDFLI